MGLGRLTIDLAAVVANWQQLAALASPAETAAVVKADAYGLGMTPVAQALNAAGCETFFVASLAEGVALRAYLPDVAIIVLSEQVEPHVDELIAHRLTPVLNHLAAIEAWRAQGAPHPAWLHLDTGMNRLGLSATDWQDLVAKQPDWKAYGIAGLMSHYACADERDHPLNRTQRDMAMQAATAARLPLSLGNSSGIFLGEAFRGDLVRPGMHRTLSNRGEVYFDGEAAPVAGRVSMDSIVIDASHLARRPKPGDWAEIIGPNQSADTLADMAGTIGYEILTSLGQRYARTYLPAHAAARTG